MNLPGIKEKDIAFFSSQFPPIHHNLQRPFCHGQDLYIIMPVAGDKNLRSPVPSLLRCIILKRKKQGPMYPLFLQIIFHISTLCLFNFSSVFLTVTR